MMDATVRWTQGMQFSGTGQAGTTITMDSRPEHGGTDAGPSPMETVLLALGACSGMDVVSVLQKMRAPLKGLEIRITAERAEEHPRVFTSIAMEYTVAGPDLRPDQVGRAIELSQTRYCSVSAMLGRVAALTYTWRIVQTLGIG